MSHIFQSPRLEHQWLFTALRPSMEPFKVDQAWVLVGSWVQWLLLLSVNPHLWDSVYNVLTCHSWGSFNVSKLSNLLKLAFSIRIIIQQPQIQDWNWGIWCVNIYTFSAYLHPSNWCHTVLSKEWLMYAENTPQFVLQPSFLTQTLLSLVRSSIWFPRAKQPCVCHCCHVSLLVFLWCMSASVCSVHFLVYREHWKPLWNTGSSCSTSFSSS